MTALSLLLAGFGLTGAVPSGPADAIRPGRPILTTELKDKTRGKKAVFAGPKSLREKKFKVEDGDTVFITSPKPGKFSVTYLGRKHPITVADQEWVPKGMVAVRFVGVDTPETKVPVTTEGGKTVFKGQGRPGQIAKKAMKDLIASSDHIEVAPLKTRPFDLYSRILGTIYAVRKDAAGKTERIDVNRWLIENGHGEMFAFYNGNFDFARFTELGRASKAAVEGHRGIYGSGPEHLRESPSAFRRRVQHHTSRQYVADMSTRTLHYEDGIKTIQPWNRVWIPPFMVERARKELKLDYASGVTAPELK